MRSEEEVHHAIEQYANMVWRLCMLHLKNRADTEDIFQTVFIKYATHKDEFENETHEKAWITRVTINACKDLIKSFFHSHTIALEDYMEQLALPKEDKGVLEAVLSLPQKYRDVVYLHYYEGYSAPELSQILHKNINTIYTLLHRSKQMLKEKLGGEDDE